MSHQLTIAIAARNAAVTIDRALGSCREERDCPILLIDDHSTDDTVARARATAGPALRVLQPPDHGGVAAARQFGLEQIETRYAAWLDADDEWVSGRAGRLVAQLEAGADVAAEAIDLYDGITGTFLRSLTVPAFLTPPGAAVRLFERNFLPGDTQVAFRTEVFRKAGGYDPAVVGPESYDVLLRSLARGARVAFGDEVGYRMYAYPDSVSRHVDRQRASLVRALRKHGYGDIDALYARAGINRRLTAWALVTVALFRREPDAALAFLEFASPADADPGQVLEPDGPWPYPEGWRRAYTRGTALLLTSSSPTRAAEALARAEAIDPTAEGANNLGVALAQAGQHAEAETWFAAALERYPGYRDASLNAGADRPSHITTHPLRHTPSRTDYAAA